MNRAVSFVIGFALEVICFPSVHGAGFGPARWLCENWLPQKRICQVTLVSVVCPPGVVWKGLTCCLRKVKLLQNLIRATGGKSHSLSSLPFLLRGTAEQRDQCNIKHKYEFKLGRPGEQEFKLTKWHFLVLTVRMLKPLKYSKCRRACWGVKAQSLTHL